LNKTCFDLTDRVAVVLGGTSGLGRAISLGLAAHGADVVPAGRRPDVQAEVCKEIQSFGRRTIEVTIDVTARQSIAQLRTRVLEQFGGVDILVNAAGITFRKPTVDISDAEWSSLFETNLEGVLHGCQIFYEALKSSAGFLCRVPGSGCLLRFESRSAFADAQPGY
jgi:NAD(P)-dependent dehydrogenase (short-subunit alcohol dehydrogenase family)